MHRAACCALAFLLTVALSACDNPAPGEGVDAPPMRQPAVVAATDAIQFANIATTDPESMDAAEIDNVISQGPRCYFAFGAESQPVFAAAPDPTGNAQGVVKIHGRLVRLHATKEASLDALGDGATFTAEDMRIEIRPQLNEGGTKTESDAKQQATMYRRPADLLFDLKQGLHVGYRGWHLCGE